MTPDTVGVSDDEHAAGSGAGIYLHPAEWNVQRLPGREEQLLGYFFKLVYIERVRQVKRWGDQRHPDGTTPDAGALASTLKTLCQKMAAAGQVTWMDILLEEIGEVAECEPVVGVEDMKRSTGENEPDLEAEMIQSAVVLAAWHSDICRRLEEMVERRSHHDKGDHR